MGGHPQRTGGRRAATRRRYLYRHLVNVGVARAARARASRLDARLLRLFGPVVYVAGLLGLLLVLVAGSTINGAHAWIRLGGGFELQPSEFMKLGLIVGMAVLFTQRGADRDEDRRRPTHRRRRAGPRAGGAAVRR